MKKFEGMLICTDLDGTLLRGDKTISRENLEAIEYFKSEGGYFTFITGRMPYFAIDMYNAINPNAPIGCINGGGIYDYKAQKYIHTVTLDKSAMTLVRAVDESLPHIGIQILAFDKMYFPKDSEANVHFRKSTGMPLVVRHYDDITEPVAKVVFGEHRNKEILELADFLAAQPLAPEFSLIRSDSMLYEILPKGVSKGSALPILAKCLGVDMKNTIAVGDYDNDITMLKAAGVGYAVSNATDAAKAAADKITVSNEEHAIAKIISEI